MATRPNILILMVDQLTGTLFPDGPADFLHAPNLKRLAARFRHSQKFMQDDPWAERVAGKDADLHQHLAEVRPLAMTEFAA